MNNLTEFMNEVQSIDVTVKRYYLVSAYWFTEDEIPTESRSGLQMKEYLTVNMSSPKTIRKRYNGAKGDLILLTNSQRKDVLKALKSFSYAAFYSKLSEFYPLFVAGQAHPMHEADFLHFLSNNFICSIPDNGSLSVNFIDNLIEDVGNKKDICDKLMNDINETYSPPSMPMKLIKSLTINQQTHLYSKLTESLFLPDETDFDSFCFVFGNSMKPDNFKPLRWLKNRQLLRELITTLKHPKNKIPTSKYKLPPYFIDKDNNPIIELPTNTPKDLKIEHYLENLAKM